MPLNIFGFMKKIKHEKKSYKPHTYFCNAEMEIHLYNAFCAC